MRKGDLQPQVGPRQHLDPRSQGQRQRDDDEQGRANDVKEQMHHRCALGRAVGAHAGQQRGYAGSDVLAEEDKQRRLQADRPRGRQRLQDAHAGRAALQKRRYARAHQHAHKWVPGQFHHVAEALPLLQGFHGRGHGVHAHKQNAQPHHDLSKQLEAGPVARQLANRAYGGKQDAKIQFDRQHQGGHGGADIGAHDDPDGLAQGQQPRVDKTHHHHRGGAGGLNHRRDQQAHQHGRQLVAGQRLQQALHLAAGRLFQTIAHRLDAKQKQSQAAQQ